MVNKYCEICGRPVGACPNLKYFANECKKEGLKVQGEVNKIVKIN